MISYLLDAAIHFTLFLAFVLVFTSILAYATHRVPKRLELRNFRAEHLPSDWQEIAATYSNQLYSLGFVRTGFVSSAPASAGYVELLIHPGLPVSANVILTTSGEQRAASVELKTRFDDGYAVATVKSSLPATFDYPDFLEMHRPKVDWVRELLNEQLTAVEAAGTIRTPLAAPQVETAASIMEEEEAMTMHQVARGLLREAKDGQTLRYTARGALRATFRVWRRFSFLKRPAADASPPTTKLARAA